MNAHLYMKSVFLASSLLCSMIVSAAPIYASSLPEHIVKKTSLAPSQGLRVQIDAMDDITKNQCISLIDAYRNDGAPEGQVSVHKASKTMGGKMLPWCVENFDGEGIQFNDLFFQQN